MVLPASALRSEARSEPAIRAGAMMLAVLLHFVAIWWMINFRPALPPATDTALMLVEVSSLANLAAPKIAGGPAAPDRTKKRLPERHGATARSMLDAAAVDRPPTALGTLAPGNGNSEISPAASGTLASAASGSGGGGLAHVKFMPPRVVRHWMGPYPNSAFHNNEQGTVKVLVTIAADGALVAAGVATSSGSNALDDAAIDTVKHFVFKPGQRDGVAEQMDAYVDINWIITAAVIRHFAVSQGDDRETTAHFVRSDNDGRVPAGVPQNKTELRNGSYLGTLKENRD